MDDSGVSTVGELLESEFGVPTTNCTKQTIQPGVITNTIQLSKLQTINKHTNYKNHKC